MRTPLLALTLALAAGGGCDESDAVAVSITLAGDLSGEVSICRLELPEAPGAVETQSAGVSWTHRARLTCTKGTFADVTALAVADLSFQHGGGEAGGLSWLRVRVPRGPAARWPAMLTIPEAAARARAVQSFDAAGRLGGIGGMLKLSLDLPREIVTQGVAPSVSGVSTSGERRHAELLVPIEEALEDGAPLLWTVTWEP